MRRCVIVRDRYPASLPFHLSILSQIKELLWRGGTAVRRINVLLVRHDGGRWISLELSSETTEGLKNVPQTDAECWFLPAELRFCRFPSSAEWKTDGVIWELDLWY